MTEKREKKALKTHHTPMPMAESGCPVDALVSLIMGPWTAYIVWVLLLHGSTRFSDLMKNVHGISARMLTVRLRRLEAAGLVRREQHLGIPPHVCYELTARGRELGQIMHPLESLANKWFMEDQAARRATASRADEARLTLPQLQRI